MNWLLAPATLWGLAAAVPAVAAEYLYRVFAQHGWPWWQGLPIWIPFQLAIGYCIYRLVIIPQLTLMDAFVVWAFSTTFLRVAVSVFLLNDFVKPGTWFALLLLMAARAVQTWYGR